MNFHIITIGLLLGALYLAGAWRKTKLRSGFMPPGQLVDIGGYRLHLLIKGQGQPTVVIDAGQGDFSLSWMEIFDQVAQFTRVCTYDRAGLGWSDTSPHPRTAEVMVDELHRLLTTSGIPGPYVLVGASTGGLNARLFTHTYPEEVVGLVLVDSAHEDQFSAPEVKRAIERMSKLMPVVVGAFRLLVRSGLAALLPGLMSDPTGLMRKLPKKWKRAYQAILFRDTKQLETSSAELSELETTHTQLRDAGINNLADLPLIVLQHGSEQPMMGAPEVAQALEESFDRLQKEMASLSSSGKHIVAEGSGHAIHLDRPELVAESIREVVVSARSRHSEAPTALIHPSAVGEPRLDLPAEE